ncbi:MAG: DUF2184 domain-containing protein [Rhodobacteraceae bacterium]|nr:DUF2184 domain-containing protein [Paracoccaceae bacterium]
MSFANGQIPNRVNANDFLVGQFEDFKNVFYEVKFGAREWRNIVPEASVDTSINPGATSTSYGVIERKGKGQFRGRYDDSVSTVEIARDKNTVPIAVAGVAAVFDREDARQIMMGFNSRLLTDLPVAMKESCEDHVEGVIMYGDGPLGFIPYLDYTGVPSSTAVNGAGGSSTWALKTAEEIVFDVNDAITSVWVDSKFIHLPDTVRIPGEQFALLSTVLMSQAADKSLLEWLKANNIYTARTGKPLNIVPLRYLDTAGSGGTPRMMVEEVDPEFQLVPFSIPFDLLPPQERGYASDLYAEYKFGSYHLRYPLSRRYVDGL